jgi:hypothetical protein
LYWYTVKLEYCEIRVNVHFFKAGHCVR